MLVAPEASEDASGLLQELSGIGVVIDPPIEVLGPDEGYTLDLAAAVTLRAYFESPLSKSRRALVRRRLNQAGLTGGVTGRLRWRVIRDEDWAESWKEYYQIEHLGLIVIRPVWIEYEASSGELVVSLDPGMAFGTGQHATTRMCLEALEDFLVPESRVLDLGTGSGILAIAAIRLGAGETMAVDTEEQAVAAAVSNSEINGMSGKIRVIEGSLDAVEGDGPFDLILANINASTISALAPSLSRVLKPGGFLVAGGIIENRAKSCADALVEAGFRIERRLEEGDWRSLVCRSEGLPS